ncbi:MAG: hypothetical protein ACE5JS_21720, partial [Nitrospinota bacterium]
DDYSSTVAQMRTAADPSEVGSESQPTSMAGELERLRYVWKTTFAWSQWYALKEGVLPRSFLAGLGLANNAVDADHDIDIAVGEARGSGDDADLNLTSAITKQIDAAWAVGTNAGASTPESLPPTPGTTSTSSSGWTRALWTRFSP